MRAEHLQPTVKTNLDAVYRGDTPAHAAANAAAADIAARRIACGDPNLAQMPDDQDLLGLVDYAVTFRSVPGTVWRQDLLDALVIRDWLDHDRDRQRFRILEGLRTTHDGVPGLSFMGLAAAMGIAGHKATAESRYKRLMAVVTLGIRHERAVRAARRADAETTAAAMTYLRRAAFVAEELIRGRPYLPRGVHYDLGLLEAALHPPQPKLVGLVWQLVDDIVTDHLGPHHRIPAALRDLCVSAQAYLHPALRRRTHEEG